MADRTHTAREVRIACIGGGGRHWPREMMMELALRPEITGTIALYDINFPAASRNARWGREVFAHRDARTRFRVRAHRTLAAALRRADLVLISIQPGPMTMMVSDIEIPRKYGILHAVGDTAGPAGVVRGLRCVPLYMEYARAVMDECPNAWVMNFTNPLALCVAALYAAAPGIKAVGYCHEMQYRKRELAAILRERCGLEECRPEEIEVDASGVNHFLMARRISWRGMDLMPVLRELISRKGFFADRTEVARERKAGGRYFEADGLVAFDFLRRFGVLGIAGDRHLVEFVPWYISSEEELHRWGVVVTPTEYRLSSRPDDRRGEQAEHPERLRSAGPEYPQQMLALLGCGEMRAMANVPNRGQTPDWPLGAVVETHAVYRRDAVDPIAALRHSPIVSGWQQRAIEQHMTTLEAARTCDRDLALQAVAHDPLVRLSTDRVWSMLNEMLDATRAMLPGWNL
ncbi:MAG: alpha-glucosidase/alpha-galactosidase [Candidatus Brocadiaceae bacterium]|nr:alpha-glucosidase/alpha-galactosidase [Candidatus Brocadiaceae bacterium]